jgi:peptide/nickel transport system ATP-binding protein
VSALRLHGLGIRHDGQQVVRDISLRIDQGESLCLIGASGCGKSLIAAALAGLLPDCMSANGRIELHDRTVTAADQIAVRALWHSHTCLLPQEPTEALAPLLRAVDQVRLAPPRIRWAEAVTWLARFGLDRDAARRMPFALSGGMAQRLLASLAMRTGSRVLIVDEPTKGLDEPRRAELTNLLVRLRDAGRALLVITHDLDVVRALGGKIAVLEDGTLTEQGDVAQVLKAPRSAFAQACLAADPSRWAAAPPRQPGSVVADVEGLVIGHGRQRLAGPLAFPFAAGTMTALLGPSGVGKTTLGDTLLGLLPPIAGRINWLGRLLDRRTGQELRARFQKLHQDPASVFPPGRSFGDSLNDLRRLSKGPELVRGLPALLDRLGVPARLLDRRPGAVSGGEAQRLALARVLAARPAFLVADEPSSRLDPPVQATALRLLRSLVDEEGLAVLLITHDHTVAGAMTESLVTLSTGGGWPAVNRSHHSLRRAGDQAGHDLAR